MNKLEQAIASGKKVKGLRGYIQCKPGDEPIYVPIEVVGIVPVDGDLRIRLKGVMGTVGEFILAPKYFIDNLKEAMTRQETARRKKLAQADLKRLIKTNYGGSYGGIRVTQTKQNLIAYVREHFSKTPKINKFIERVLFEDLIKLQEVSTSARAKAKRTLYDDWHKQANGANLKELCEIATEIRHEVDLSEDYDD